MARWKVYSSILLLAVLFASSTPTVEPLFLFLDKGKVGFIDEHGKIIIPAIYAEAGYFEEGLAQVRKDGYFGYINTAGEMVIPAKYDFATPFHDGMAVVYKDSLPQFINNRGILQFEAPFLNIGNFHHGVASAQNQKGRCGIVNKSGKLIVDTSYGEIRNYANGLYLFYKYNNIIEKIAWLEDESFQTITDYTNITKLGDGFLTGNKQGPDNKTFTVLFDSTLHVYTQFSAANLLILAATKDRVICRKSLSGNPIATQLIDFHGKIFYADTRPGTEIGTLGYNRYLVSHFPDKSIIIDQYGRVLDSVHSMAGESFDMGVALICKSSGGLFQLVDTNLHVVTDIIPSGKNERRLTPGYIVTETGARYGIADVTGKEIVKPELDYEGIISKRFGLFIARQNKLPVYINLQGKMVWTMQLDTTKRPKDISRQAIAGIMVNPGAPDNYRQNNLPALPIKPSQHFAKGKIQVIVRTDTIVNFGDHYTGHQVLLVNTTNRTSKFALDIGKLSMTMQAFQNNRWIDIEFLRSSWCGNAYSIAALKPRQYWSLACAQYTGTINTDLRIRLSSGFRNGFTVYSNIFKGNINPGQLWRKEGYTYSNLMFPEYRTSY